MQREQIERVDLVLDDGIVQDNDAPRRRNRELAQLPQMTRHGASGIGTFIGRELASGSHPHLPRGVHRWAEVDLVRARLDGWNEERNSPGIETRERRSPNGKANIAAGFAACSARNHSSATAGQHWNERHGIGAEQGSCAVQRGSISKVLAYTGSHRTWGCISRRTLR